MTTVCLLTLVMIHLIIFIIIQGLLISNPPPISRTRSCYHVSPSLPIGILGLKSTTCNSHATAITEVLVPTKKSRNTAGNKGVGKALVDPVTAGGVEEDSKKTGRPKRSKKH
jgi:hypothetical protein